MNPGDARVVAVVVVVAMTAFALLGCPKSAPPRTLLSPVEAQDRVEEAAASRDWTAVDSDGQAECARVGGRWETFGTTAADTCYAWLSGDDGGDAVTPSCDCGAGRCWLFGTDRATCVAHSEL